MRTDARGFDVADRPDGSLSGLIWDAERRHNAVMTHATFEGHDVDPRAVSEGYDRALHPWIRGWRPYEIRKTVRSLLPF